MSLQITKALSAIEYDAEGALIQPSYWKITSIDANTVAQTFTLMYSGYASSAAYTANPTQTALACQVIAFPDPVNAPNATWPFSSAALASNYPNNPLAFLLAAEAYAMLNPFFAGATQVP